MSRYCAYLVSFAPDLLSDGAALNGFFVKQVREIAQSEIRRWGTWRIQKLIGKIRKVLHMKEKGALQIYQPKYIKKERNLEEGS